MLDALETGLDAAPALLAAAGRQSLYVAIVALVAGVVTVALRRRAPLLHLGLWGLVLARLVLPVDLASPYTARDLLDRSGAEPATLEAATAEAAPMAAAPEARPRVGAGTETEVPPLARLRAALSWQAVILGFWLVGTVGFLGRYLTHRRRFRRLVRRAAPLDAPALKMIQTTWTRRLGIRRAVRVVTSAESTAPFTLGTVRPVIYLPTMVAEHADRSIAESVLAHELAHVARFDDALLTVCRILECLYCFHPAVWIAGRKINDACEHLTDGLVVAHGADARTYGRSLLAILEWNLSPARAAVAMNPSKRWIMRLHTLLASETAPRPRPLPVLLATLLLGVFLLPMAGAEPSADSPGVDRTALDRGFVIVAHANDPATSISPESLRALFLKRERAEQTPARQPVDLRETSPVREAFSTTILGEEVETVKSYWQRMIFAGIDVPPNELANDAAVLDYVAEHPGAVGYVSPSIPLPATVKILRLVE